MEEEAESNQYLTFELDEEIFALDIGKVREVLDITTLTKVPQAPSFMRGVINLRGNVVPVVDLRMKFGICGAETTVHTCIVITEVRIDGETVILGAIADSVQEVVDLDPGQIEAPPRIGSHMKTDFIKGMGRHNDRFIMILDIDKIFAMPELDELAELHVTANAA